MRTFFILIAILFSCVEINAQQAKDIKLKAPNKERGASVMKALANRQSTNEYSDKALSDEDLSDLLWAANGINRPESGKRTSASAMNRQDVMIYTFSTEAVHLYNALTHELKLVTKGDYRVKLFGERALAPLIVLFVTDVSKFGEVGTLELRKEWGAIDIGLASQNMAIFCAGNGIGTKPRAGMEREAIKTLLNLTESQLPMLNHPVGYAK